MKQPIDMMLDGIDWVPAQQAESVADDGLPYVTHTGVLDIAGHKLRVHQLSNGQRVIAHEDLDALFESWL